MLRWGPVVETGRRGVCKGESQCKWLITIEWSKRSSEATWDEDTFLNVSESQNGKQRLEEPTMSSLRSRRKVKSGPGKLGKLVGLSNDGLRVQSHTAFRCSWLCDQRHWGLVVEDATRILVDV